MIYDLLVPVVIILWEFVKGSVGLKPIIGRIRNVWRSVYNMDGIGVPRL